MRTPITHGPDLAARTVAQAAALPFGGRITVMGMAIRERGGA